MNSEIYILLSTAVSIAFIHTLLGPDHYVPFIAISKSQNWSKLKTFRIVLLCGVGHVFSSFILGAAGYFIGREILSLETIDSFRSDIAGWMLIIFGLLYFIWGLRFSQRKKTHSHIHVHNDGTVHAHVHDHFDSSHTHIHQTNKNSLVPWVLFLIFVFGPCEPLIPLLIYPAVEMGFPTVLLISISFLVVTVITMEAAVFSGIFSLKVFTFNKIKMHVHSLAGISILLCGVAIKYLGL